MRRPFRGQWWRCGRRREKARRSPLREVRKQDDMRLTPWRLFAIASLLLPLAPAATRPHYGGTLRVQMKARVMTLDPADFAAHENFAALAFDRLVTLNESAQAQPALATTWRHDADYKRWEFQLRPGVKFHNGD